MISASPLPLQLSRWHHPDVRNLAWVLSAPSMLAELPGCIHPVTVTGDDEWQAHFTAYQDRLDALERDPTPLTRLLAAHRNHRLGYYFEYLLLFWLEDASWHPYRLLRHHAAVREGHMTVGELDFLVADSRTGRIEHWEVAVKFFLGHPPLDDPWRWQGPNGHDTLGAKLDHLAQRQFRFEGYGEHAINDRRLVMKGRLFYPAGTGAASPACLSASHLRGLWTDRQTLQASPRAAGMLWRHAGRDEWLADQQPSLNLPLYPLHRLLPPPSTRPELFIGFDPDGRESLRCFLMPDRPANGLAV